MATATAQQSVRIHHPRCPNIDSGVPAVAEWTGQQLDDLLAHSGLFVGCGFCRAMFPTSAPDYSPPRPYLTRKPSPRPRVAPAVAPEGGRSDDRD